MIVAKANSALNCSKQWCGVPLQREAQLELHDCRAHNPCLVYLQQLVVDQCKVRLCGLQGKVAVIGCSCLQEPLG